MNQHRPVSTPTPIAGVDHGGFIPSLEGMRALAVVATVLFHLGLSGAGGGYLGIDLFFVISGFIITRNIVFDQGVGKFSLGKFYVRRIRRLLPALLVTVLITLLAALACMPPVEVAQTAKSAFFAIFSLANVSFWVESGYFDAEAQFKPLLHTWTLSVEEQFYLLWPAMLLWLGISSRRAWFTSVLIALSLGASLFYRDSLTEAVFYLLPFRVYEFMSGALVAILAARFTGTMANAATVLGLTGFLTMTVLVTEEHTPAVTAALMCGLGVCMLLGRSSQVAAVALSNKPMQWVGARSYAIYLVHWPIFVLYQYVTDFDLSTSEQVLLSAISIAAAMALHELVEKPFRITRKPSPSMQRMAGPVTALMLLVAVGVSTLLWQQQGMPSRLDPKIQSIVASVEQEQKLRRKAIRWGQCNLHKGFKISDYNVKKCASLDADRSNVFVIGDSIAADTYMMLSQAYPDIHFAQATAGACTALRDPAFLRAKYPPCVELNTLRFEELAKSDMDLIVLASNWTEERIPPLVETVEYLRSIGKRVLIFGPRAVFAGPVPMQISQQRTLEGLNARLHQEVNRKASILQSMRTALPDTEIVDIATIQCTPLCDAIEGEQLLYLDAFHLSKLGALRVGERFRDAFDLPGFIQSPTTQQ